jgi:hypothetical protein
MKKGQVTIFILIGIVLVITFVVLITLKEKVTSTADSDIATNFEVQKVQLASQIKDCIEIQSKEIVDNYGLGYGYDEIIREHIENNLDNCVDFEAFERQGLKIDKEEIIADANVSGNYLIVKVNYPMVLTNRFSKSEINAFVYNMEISKEKFLPLENGFVTENTVVELKDAGIKLEIERGTEITQISKRVFTIDIRGKDILQQYFDTNVADKIYNLGPDNAQFSKPVKLTVSYDTDILPEGVTEDELSIVYYDEELARWVAVDTIVDKNKKIAVADINHFSLYSLAWMMDRFEEDPGAFFGGDYVHQFCNDLKRDLDAKVEAFAFVLFYDDCLAVRSPQICESYYNKTVFSDIVAAAMSSQAEKNNKFAKAFSRVKISDYRTNSAVGQRLFFDILRRQPLFGSGWCSNNGIELGHECIKKIEACISGSQNCEGVTSISDIFSKCWEKANVIKEAPIESEVDLNIINIFGNANCAEILPEDIECLGIRCTELDGRYQTEMCYEFETDNPLYQECPEGYKLTIGYCPDDNFVRCCVRNQVFEYYNLE